MEAKKNPDLDLNHNSSLYFSIGLCLMLFVTNSLLNFKTYDKEDTIAEILEMSQEVEEDIPLLNIDVPPPPPPPPTAAPEVIVIVEDIVDSGITMDKMISLLEMENPKDMKICTLLYKPDAFKGRKAPDYVGFSIPNAFVVGYGLDYDEKGRNLDAIYQIKE